MAQTQKGTRLMKRSEAIKLNLPKYTTDKPCKNGHHAPRYTKTAICTACHSIRLKDWDRNNPGRRQELARKWAIQNPERVRQLQEKYRDRRMHPTE